MTISERAERAILWRDGTAGRRRGFAVILGYDCRKTCEHEHKGDHGIHGDEWVYTVGVEDAALVLTIYAHEWSAKLTPYPDSRREGPTAADLAVHFAYPTTEEAIRTGEGPTSCLYVPMGCVRSASSAAYNAAGALWTTFGQPQREQSEAFWRALEADFDERIAALRAAREALVGVSRCPTCCGAGVVKE